MRLRSSKLLLPLITVKIFALSALAEVSFPQPVTQRLEDSPDPAPQNMDQVSFEQALPLLQKNEWGEAAIILKRVVNNHPTHFEAIDALSKSLTYLRRREEALAVLIRAHSLQPHDKWVERIRVISQIFERGDDFQRYQTAIDFMQGQQCLKAIEKLKEVQINEPHNIQVLLRLAQCHFKEGQVDTAWEYLETAKKLNPFEPEVRLWLGRTLALRGTQTDALSEFKIATQQLQKSELATVWTSESLSSLGKIQEAKSILETDLKSHPLHLLALMKLADLHMLSGQAKGLQQAREQLKLAEDRWKEYQLLNENRFESELGYHLESVNDIKDRLQNQLLLVDRRLAEVTGH